MRRKKIPKSDRDSEEQQQSDDSSRRQKYFLAFTILFMFPAVIYVFNSVAKISKTLRFTSSLPIYGCLGFIAVVVVVVCLYFRTTLKGLLMHSKYLALILLSFLLLPSLQVYSCSPVVLVNKDMGTRFKLGTSAEEILQDCGEYCLRYFSKSLYALSLVTPRVTLQVMDGEVVDMNITTNSIGSGSSLKNSRIYLIFSLRSVKGKVHSLSMITKIPFRSTKIIEALGGKKGMKLTGKIVNIGSDLKEMKGNLERSKLFVRPVVFEPYSFEVHDDDEL